MRTTPMRTAITLAPAALLAAPTAGCTRNTIVVIAPPPDRAAASPCRWGPDLPPVAPAGRADAVMFPEMPPDARARRVGGRAGPLFRIGPDGRAADMRAARESPAGHGFGQADAAAPSADAFHPPVPGPAWRYATVTFTPSP